MTWGGADAESYLEVDVKLNLTLEVGVIIYKSIAYTVTFIFLSFLAVGG